VNADVRLVAAAICCLAAMLALGAYVARRPLTGFDLETVALRGRGTKFAVLFTRSGYWPALTGITLVLFAASLIAGTGPVFAIVLGATQLLSQAASDVTKACFKRIRPDDWLFHQELGFSYPSGHATTAVVFYGGLLLFVWNAPGPRSIAVAATVVLVVLIGGIPWSRVVLSAHYGTDVLGGMLFGGAWLCLMAALLRHLPGTHAFG
jgi:membrane-associated phospholipid phosphatase